MSERKRCPMCNPKNDPDQRIGSRADKEMERRTERIEDVIAEMRHAFGSPPDSRLDVDWCARLTAALDRERANMGKGVAMMLQERNAAILKVADRGYELLNRGGDGSDYAALFSELRRIAGGK